MTVHSFTDRNTVNDQTLFEQINYFGIAHSHEFGFWYRFRWINSKRYLIDSQRNINLILNLGTVFAAYINFGANPAHLITATLMAAPATLCYAKLFYPETEKIIITSDNVKLEKS